jgi:hypothetical protein
LESMAELFYQTRIAQIPLLRYGTGVFLIE